MNNYKLIAIDMDGTLLTSDKKILRETKEDLQYAHNKGVTVCICTGRGYPAARKYVDELELEMPLILYNGCRIRYSQNPEVLYNQVIEFDVAKKVYELITKYNGTCCFWREDKLYFNKNDEYALYYEQITSIKPTIIEQISDDLLTNINKFIWCGEFDWLEKVRKEILIEIEGINYFKSQPRFLEIVPPSVDKGQSLNELCKLLGIAQDEVIAIGDEENDLSMIKYAGMGVAMSNAKDIVKENANYITLSNDENGVGEVVRKFIV